MEKNPFRNKSRLFLAGFIAILFLFQNAAFAQESIFDPLAPQPESSPTTTPSKETEIQTTDEFMQASNVPEEWGLGTELPLSNISAEDATVSLSDEESEMIKKIDLDNNEETSVSEVIDAIQQNKTAEERKAIIEAGLYFLKDTDEGVQMNSLAALISYADFNLPTLEMLPDLIAFESKIHPAPDESWNDPKIYSAVRYLAGSDEYISPAERSAFLRMVEEFFQEERELFSLVDPDKDWKINLEEILPRLQDLAQEATLEKLERLKQLALTYLSSEEAVIFKKIAELDENKNFEMEFLEIFPEYTRALQAGQLAEARFLDGLAGRFFLQEEEKILWRALAILDANLDGFIGADEVVILRKNITTISKFPDPSWGEINYDANQDGYYTEADQLGSLLDNFPESLTTSLSFPEDEKGMLELPRAAANGKPIEFEVVKAPEGMDVSIAEGYLQMVPAKNFSGEFSYSLQGIVGEFGVPFEVKISGLVVPQNDPPVMEAQNFEGKEDGLLKGTLRAVDPDGDSLSFEVVNPPAGKDFSFDAATGTFYFTPDENASGLFTFTVRVRDEEFSSEEVTVSLNVLPVNDPPVVKGAAVTQAFAAKSFIEIPVESLDIEGDPLEFIILSKPKYGEILFDQASQKFRYYPRRPGIVEEILFKATDGKAESEPASLKITVLLPGGKSPAATNRSGNVETKPESKKDQKSEINKKDLDSLYENLLEIAKSFESLTKEEVKMMKRTSLTSGERAKLQEDLNKRRKILMQERERIQLLIKSLR